MTLNYNKILLNTNSGKRIYTAGNIYNKSNHSIVYSFKSLNIWLNL